LVVVAVPITDTCKEVVDGYIQRTVPRDTLADARGPWMFPRETLTRALDRVSSREAVTTLIDLCRAAQLDVRVMTLQ
jgi:2-C-methyl-D-erythritol 4-phosphate cytidylyltransferase